MSQKTTCHIGTSGWSYDTWKNEFYPADVPKTKWFNYYSNKFDTVEMNATFYRSFPEKTFQRWHDQAPKNFLYVFKANRFITHRKYLQNASDSIKKFCDSVKPAKEKMALMLLQLHPRTLYDLDLLKEAIKAFDHPSEVVVEFRDEKWFNDDVCELLNNMGCVFSNLDSPEIKQLHVATSKKAYYRFHGSNDWYRHNYSTKQLHSFAEAFEKLAGDGVKEIFAYFNNDVDANAPKNALHLKEIIKEEYKKLELK